MANPYTSAQAGGGLSAVIAPDIAVQQQQLMRQQQLADMLRQQSMENDDGTQVINGWAVQKSPFEHLAKLGQAYYGKQMQDGIDTKNAELSKAYMGRLGEILAGGRPAASAPSTPVEVPSTPTSVPSTPQSSEPADPAALAAALSAPAAAPNAAPATPAAPDPYSVGNLLRGQVIEQIGGNGAGNAYWKQYEPTDQQRNDLYLGISPTESRRLTLAARTRDGVLSLDPGKTAIMPDGTVRVAADFNNGISGGYINGDLSRPTAAAVPGAAQVKAEVAGAVKRGEAQVGDQGAVPTPVEIKTPTLVPGVGMVQPGTYMLSPSQQRAMANGGIDPLYPASPNAQQMPGYPITGVTADQIIGSVRDPQQRSNVVAAIGQGPSGSLVQVPSAAEKKGAEGLATYGVDVQKDIDSRLSSASAQNMDLQEARDALQRFRAGGGTEFKAKLASIAQGMGFSQATVDQIGKGDLGAVQQFNSAMSRQTLAALKSTLGAGNPIRMAELAQFEASNPHLDTDPRAMEKVFDFQDKLYKEVRTERREFANYVKGGNQASDFPGYWAEQRAKLGFTNPTGSSQPTNAITPSVTLDDIAAEIARRKAGAK